MSRELAATISRVLKRARRRCDLTQAELAEMAGLATEAYGRLERGVSLPRADTLLRLASVLDISTDVLLGLPGGATAEPRLPLGFAERREPYGIEGAELRRLLRLLRRWSPETLRSLRRLVVALERELRDENKK